MIYLATSKELELNTRLACEILTRGFIKKGYKEKAFKIVFEILSCLKFRSKQDPAVFLEWLLAVASYVIELRVNKLFKVPKKQKGRPKLRGRLFPVTGARVLRRAVKEVLKNSLSRSEDTAIEKVVEEFMDMSIKKGVTLRKKREFYTSILGARATLEVVKRHRRRKRINRL